MIAMLLLLLLVLTIAGYVAGTLTVAVETPVSDSDRGIAYWAFRARYHETGPNAGIMRGFTKCSACGEIVPALEAHYCPEIELVRTCALLHDVSECCTEENCAWMCGHVSERLNHPATYVPCEWITVAENRRRLNVAF